MVPHRHITRLAGDGEALHVGTYEAAIKNMLRRVPDQWDDQIVFHLHRAALKVGPDRVNPGYRDKEP